MKRSGSKLYASGPVKKTNALQAAAGDGEIVYGGESRRVHDRPFLYRPTISGLKEVKQVFYSFNTNLQYDSTRQFTTIGIAQGTNNFNRIGRSVQVIGIQYRFSFDQVDAGATHTKDIGRFLLLLASGGADAPLTNDTYADVMRIGVANYPETDMLAGQAAPKYTTLADVVGIVNGHNVAHVDNIKTFAGAIDRKFVMTFDDNAGEVERNAVVYQFQGHHGGAGGALLRGQICMYYIDL